ncbi:MAG: TatD family hydrolase [Succinivibrio sp.]
MTYLVDSHCHLSSLSLEGKAGSNIFEIIKRARLCGVSHFLNVSCTTKEFESNLKIAKDFDEMYLACGLHPLNIDDEIDFSVDSLKECLLSSEKVIALGEIGLDYHYASETRERQLPLFADQINLAHEVKKPLIIHAREAHKDTVSILKSENARDVGGVIHCFTDTVEMARECLDLGFYISFTGISTFKPSDNVREVIKYVPLDRMMVETDCPYLAPVPVRGIENEPAFVRYTLGFIADFLHVSEEDLARITSENFEKLYNVSLKDCLVPECECSLYKIEKIAEKPFRNRYQ